MLKRIDLFMPPMSRYGVLHHFTKKLYEALGRNGITCRLLKAEYHNPKPFLEKIFNDPPDCTLSFNGLLPDNQGRFFSDLIKIPHIACLVDSPNQFFPLIKSDFTIATCVDEYSCEFFKGMGFSRTFFLPHAVERELIAESSIDKKYDVAMLASCIDYQSLWDFCRQKYEAKIFNAMNEAAERTLNDSTTPYVEAFVAALSKSEPVDLRQLDFVKILDDLEQYIRGRERIEVLKSLEDQEIHVFGAGGQGGGWSKYFPNSKNIVIHEPISFDKALEVMKASKIIINSCSWIKKGAHERIFSGIAAGALVLTNENSYMQQYFKDGDSLAFYAHKDLSTLNKKLTTYLSDDNARRSLVKKGQEVVKAHHTWDQRAKDLVVGIESFLGAPSIK